jgi:murein DD-endopeptidase MepM/ murein hydrolase activator NlpD
VTPLRAGLAILLSLLAAAPAGAVDLAFEGRATQGGLLVGRTEPAARVWVDGAAVRVSPEGLFLIGLGRDATGLVEVRAAGVGGTTAARTLAIAPRVFPVQRIDGLPPRQVTPDAETLKRIRAEGALIDRARARDTTTPFFVGGFDWPVVGRISGVFGSQRILNGEPRSPHGGIDVAAPAGTPVRAAGDGVVSLVHADMFYTGRTVMIDHGHGLASVYAHMSAILVGEGTVVRRGDPIGRVGASGRATGAHLHWGISLFGTRLDPELIAGPMPRNPSMSLR